MKKQQRAERVADRLGQLYPDPPIPLDHRDDFTLLVAAMGGPQVPAADPNADIDDDGDVDLSDVAAFMEVFAGS